MDLTPNQKTLLAYWGEIQSSVAQRASTAELWAAVRGAAQIDGADLSHIGAVDMNRLRSIAVGQRNAMENFQRARTDQVITSQMIATDVSARSAQDQLLAPSWIVRFEHDVVVSGELQTVWRSSVMDGSLPTTTGDLRSAVEEDAQALADDYDVTHAGVGRIRISAV